MKNSSVKSSSLCLFTILIIELASHSSWALNVVQWQDSMQILSNHYLDLFNDNKASLLTDKETALKQTFSVDLNNNFINTLFDVIVFDPSDEAGFNCYQNAV